jgi:hypothetical protein
MQVKKLSIKTEDDSNGVFEEFARKVKEGQARSRSDNTATRSSKRVPIFSSKYDDTFSRVRVAVENLGKRKKSVPEQADSGQVQKLSLVHAPDGESFWVSEGPVLKNLLDLHEALQNISEEQYDYHARGESNDFSKWVEEVLCDGNCARALEIARDRDHAKQLLTTHLKVYAL